MAAKQPSAEESELFLATVKKPFVERCAKCHNELGDKPLPDGPPLGERNLTATTITHAVNGRFESKSEEERCGVVAYISDFMETRPSADAPGNP